MNKSQTIKITSPTSLLEAIYNFKKDLSKKTIKSYIKNGMVSVNNKIITNSSLLLNTNDIVNISYSKKVIPNYNLDILYEDDYLIAINKPQGLLSISNDKEKFFTAYRMVSDYIKTNNKRNYIFVVHRLDQDTSGILLFCKDQKIRDKMQDNWNNIVKKRGYIALLDGKCTKDGTYHSYLLENHHQFVYSSKNNQGKEAITHYQVLKYNNNYTLVQVFIDTGRRNQIRVHFSEHGYPLVGDKKYGCHTNPLKRLCLHANILEFIHPITKKLIHLETPYPKEFNSLLKEK